MENYSYNSSYPESGDSSPPVREVEFDGTAAWEDSQSHSNLPAKVKFLCSYGGKIQPRLHDNQLCYIGGDTKILAVDRGIKFSSLLAKLVALSNCDGVSFKYQLPGEDLDPLISVINEDDMEHMLHEYDRLYRVSPKQSRLRLFIFTSQGSRRSSSTRSFGSEDGKSEKERFVEALNSGPIMAAPQPPSAAGVLNPQPRAAAANVDSLLGFEKTNGMSPPPVVQQPIVGRAQEVADPVVPGLDERLAASDPIQKHIQDLRRIRIEEQQGIYGRKSDENFAGGCTGGEVYKNPEKIPQFPVNPGGRVPYWTEKQTPDGYFASSAAKNEQSVNVIPAPSTAYHQPMVRPVTGPPNQGFYAVQMIPSEVYRDQQQMYNVNLPTAVPPQKITAFADASFGMVRPAAPSTAGVGMMMDGGAYPPVAYDRGLGRPVMYPPSGGVMCTPVPVQAAPYPAMAAAVNPGVRPAGAVINPESAAGAKVVVKISP